VREGSAETGDHVKVEHHHCTRPDESIEDGCDCGAAAANAYIAYLWQKIEILEKVDEIADRRMLADAFNHGVQAHTLTPAGETPVNPYLGPPVSF
jgi:hypothetical protein